MDWYPADLYGRLFSYLIHPKNASRLPENASVADIGAGTGAWALDAAQVLPSGTSLVAYDISAAQFPSDSPKNVTFAIADVMQPFHDHMHGTFDLVHLGHMCTSLHSSDVAKALANVVQLLKPGGSIEWTEARYGTMSCLRDSNGFQSYPTLTNLLAKFHLAVGASMAEFAPKLSQAFVDSDSLVDLEFDAVSTDRNSSTRSRWGQMLAPAYTNWAIRTLGLSPDEGKELKAGIDEDFKNGNRQPVSTITIDFSCLSNLYSSQALI